MDDVRNHDWMQGMDWERLRAKTLPSPFVPDVSRGPSGIHCHRLTQQTQTQKANFDVSHELDEFMMVEKPLTHHKRKKANKRARDAVQKSVQNFGRPKGAGDVKRQKEAALKTLVKSGKGVTVVGKKSKELAEGKQGRGRT